MIISQNQDKGNDPPNFPTFPWWASIYSLFLILGVFVVVASDTIQTYHVALTGYLAGGMVLTTSSVNSLVYSKSGAREAAAAGFILLSMVIVSRPETKLNFTFAVAHKCRLSGSFTLDQLHHRLLERSLILSP